MQIYLDYSATTPPRPEVIDLMQQVMLTQWGNPSSLHHWGTRSATLLEQARWQVGRLINAPAEAMVFTAGGTESDNLAILGVAKRFAQPAHVIISAIEHAAVSEPAKMLEAAGWEITRLPVDRSGRINPLDLQAALQPNTALVSIIWGQSEIGTIQPIAELARITHEQGALFHTDAVQMAGRGVIDVQAMPIDLLSLSSHKLYGPQGVGALYVRPGLEIAPVIGGGGQEDKLRSGTQAIANIAGFGLAAKLALAEMPIEIARLTAIRDRLFEQLADTAFASTGNRTHRLPHHASFCLPNNSSISGKHLVRQMNLAGIGISAGAACSSGKITPSPILQAIGHSEPVAQTGIRLTLGKATTMADIDWAAMALRQILERSLPTVAMV
ncbi:cysteine desulfurase [filamentous cyanobacterium LEGE 11480]|uniref:cysteine desulfurase n=1 Tax=Romeriopsis navalis LEGE 11480 TaxID=2777977 RepID=A0A928Z3B0_9CYAN|nr:cysteine desulfurase family protein [Romeriopsis navalis]MBE9028998.1 cysteine desulfurase [Romeriopsis navalis LEGE 11480]